MKYLPYDHGRSVSILGALWRSVRQRVAGFLPPLRGRPFLGRRRRRTLAIVILAVALVVQLVLLWLVGQMIDLAISLMEVWTELARKHLEITLDSSS